MVVVVVLAVVLSSGGGSKSKSTSAQESANAIASAISSAVAKGGSVGVPSGSSGSASSGDGSSSDSSSDSSGTGKALPLTDGDWRLDSVTISKDVLGDLDASAQVTYLGKAAPAAGVAAFNLEVYANGKDVGSLEGGADSGFTTGASQKIDLISGDDYVDGPYTYDFSSE